MVASHAHRNRWIWAALAALLVALMMTTAAADASGRRGDPGVRSHSGCRSYARPVYRAPRFNCSSRSSYRGPSYRGTSFRGHTYRGYRTYMHRNYRYSGCSTPRHYRRHLGYPSAYRNATYRARHYNHYYCSPTYYASLHRHAGDARHAPARYRAAWDEPYIDIPYRGYGQMPARSPQSYLHREPRVQVDDLSAGATLVTDRGWSWIAEGKAAEALNRFSDLCQAAPDRGMPRIGYAVAAGMLGDDGTAAWAMRRALEVDPDALQYFAAQEPVRQRILKLVDHYSYLAKHPEARADASFMEAATRFLLRQYPHAERAIGRAIERGDESRGAAALAEAIAAETQPRRDGGLIAADESLATR